MFVNKAVKNNKNPLKTLQKHYNSFHFISSSFGFSVMAKLPATSYVRMVDIWLIFTQLYPFLEVVLYTIIELYNEEEVTNHHGFKRDVPDKQRQGVYHIYRV